MLSARLPTLALRGIVGRSVLTHARRNMPLCTFGTNLKTSEVPADFHKQLSKVVATTLGKDEKVVSVSVDTSQTMCRDGSDAPNAVVQIWSIGVFDADRNPGYANSLYEFLVPALNIPVERIAMFFHPISKETAGHLLQTERLSKK